MRKVHQLSKDVLVGSYINKEGGQGPREIKVKNELRFIDSFKFMASSLGKLVSNLNHENRKLGLKETKLKETEKVFKDKIELVSRKGVYPYDYMDSFEKFNEAELPPKEEFYSKLNDSDISHEDYENTQKVWKSSKWRLWVITMTFISRQTFSCLQMCLKSSEMFFLRIMSSTLPGISPLLDLPGMLPWRRLIKLLTDVDIVLMIEEWIRGGVSMVSNLFGRANNKNVSEA